VLLVCRFTVPQERVAEFVEQAGRALDLLQAQPGCVHGTLGRSTDDDDRFVLSVLFESVTAYRRSMSPFPVRELVVPLLSQADNDGPSAFEVLVEADRAGGVRRHTSLVAADAGTVRVGDAAGPSRSR
jgi:quinol monooxygenase YgiN